VRHFPQAQNENKFRYCRAAEGCGFDFPAKRPTTELCAFRFADVTACVYVSMVTRLDACLSNSCMTFISAPTYLNRVEYVCLLFRMRNRRHYSESRTITR
jgi:hypothetical protein